MEKKREGMKIENKYDMFQKGQNLGLGDGGEKRQDRVWDRKETQESDHRHALKIKHAHKNKGNQKMMTQLGNARRLKRSEVNVGAAAAADSGLNSSDLRSEGSYQGDPFMRGERTEYSPDILELKRPIYVDKYKE